MLLHVTALPGPGERGTFGEAAHEWVTLLGRHGIRAWQLLPLAPTDATGSPYSSPSGSALNPALLDADRLLREGWISASDLDELSHPCNADALASALQRAWPAQGPTRQRAFRRWCRSERFWLKDHCRFMVLRRLQGGAPWWQWPPELALRQPQAMRRLDQDQAGALQAEALIQWQLQNQWSSLQRRARAVGVQLIGDLPFYVAHDSADVWARPRLFSLGPGGSLLQQSGVPPDYFSATGQLWGTPVYRWGVHLGSGFRWWMLRLLRQLELFDLLRLDHFRALQAYWSVPGSDDTAEHGHWRPSPGWLLLALLWLRCGFSGQLQSCRLRLIAEDLGVITPPVEALRDRFGLSGMKILQFAFDGNPENPYLPANIHGRRWVVYTGTHDNATSLGWWHQLDGDSRARVEAAVGGAVTAPGWQLLELALATPAELVIVPLQDLLELGDEARFNTPGTTGPQNWTWRLDRPIAALDGPLKGYGELAAAAGRGEGVSATVKVPG
ncbi:4-alpha-glucanotransferase [Synechococcus sp. GFB01]|nr:4-alpha-glucanotransferase [Synechococcus sp. GFB01]